MEAVVTGCWKDASFAHLPKLSCAEVFSPLVPALSRSSCVSQGVSTCLPERPRPLLERGDGAVCLAALSEGLVTEVGALCMPLGAVHMSGGLSSILSHVRYSSPSFHRRLVGSGGRKVLTFCRLQDCPLAFLNASCLLSAPVSSFLSSVVFPSLFFLASAPAAPLLCVLVQPPDLVVASP